MTILYAKFYSFPFLLFRSSPDVYLIAAGGQPARRGRRRVRRRSATAFALPAAVAMRPPAPPAYRRLFGGALRAPRALLPAHHDGASATDRATRCASALTAIGIALRGGAGRDGDGHARLDRLHDRRDLLPHRPAGRDDRIFAAERPPRSLPAVRGLPGVHRAPSPIWSRRCRSATVSTRAAARRSPASRRRPTSAASSTSTSSRWSCPSPGSRSATASPKSSHVSARRHRPRRDARRRAPRRRGAGDRRSSRATSA